MNSRTTLDFSLACVVLHACLSLLTTDAAVQHDRVQAFDPFHVLCHVVCQVAQQTLLLLLWPVTASASLLIQLYPSRSLQALTLSPVLLQELVWAAWLSTSATSTTLAQALAVVATTALAVAVVATMAVAVATVPP